MPRSSRSGQITKARVHERMLGDRLGPLSAAPAGLR